MASVVVTSAEPRGYTQPSHPSFPCFDDARGRLVPVEFADAPFRPQRVFVVVAPEDGATRGEHGVPCRQLLVLVVGAARVVVTTPVDGGTPQVLEHHLTVAGETCLLEPGSGVTYHLTGGATLVALADEAYSR